MYAWHIYYRSFGANARGRAGWQPSGPAPQRDRTVRIAIATDDGRTVSTHFSRATHFAVVTVDRGVIVARELRARATQHRPRSRTAAPAQEDEALAPIADCALVVARHIGWRARDRMAEIGLTPIVTDRVSVDDATADCAAGRIVNIAQPLH